MWYILAVPAGREESAAQDIRNALRGCAEGVFAPYWVRARRYEGSWHMERVLLFLGYVFADSSRPDEMKERLRLLSDVSPVCTGDDLFRIEPSEQRFLERLMSPTHVVGFSVGDLLGDRLVIESSPLMDCTDRVCRIDRHKRTAEVEYRLWGEARRMRVGLEIRRKEKNLSDGV